VVIAISQLRQDTIEGVQADGSKLGAVTAVQKSYSKQLKNQSWHHAT